MKNKKKFIVILTDEYYHKPNHQDLLKKEVYKSKNVIICDNKTSQKGVSNKNFVSEFKYFNGFQFLDQSNF